MELQTQNTDDILNIVEVAKNTGKVKKGVNEVTKMIERGTAQLVVVATDVSPAEIIMHIKPLCEEKKIPFAQLGTKEELGVAAGLHVGSVAVAVVDAGEAKKTIQELAGSSKKEKSGE